MTRISEKKARELGLIPKQVKSKYHSRKTIIDNITFDSKREADYYGELKLRKRAGDILDFELQPEFVLQNGFRRDGKAIRAIKYRADFKVVHKDFSVEIVDVKGYLTKEYALKKKMLLAKFPDIRFTEA
jgi:hypothetical protein